MRATRSGWEALALSYRSFAAPDPAIETALQGVVTDDGLPDPPSRTTAQWSQLTGPAPMAFLDASNPRTPARFDAPGDYRLRLSANDSALSASADVTLHVNPVDAPPVVNAGGDLTIRLPGIASLSGQVSDDGIPAGGSLTPP